MNLYLIGYRCTGKSTIGRRIAEAMGRPFIDADDVLEKRTGRSIREIFATDGEARFRDLESECLAEIAGTHRCAIVATGGGVILRPENVQRMKNSGCVVLLEADAETIHERLAADGRTVGQRPRLTGKNSREEIQELLAARASFYAAAAEARYNTAVRPAAEVAAEIVLHLQSKERPR
ncbi:MAG: shikimate kinase [Planctomycetes bacterium]|nr:shikimate kinase [Planctomycetota bacterium]